ncbi:MAG: RNA pyrophosphohydrolase [Rickettsiales bacterium]|nr:RNA pyrophosphohydrolase [Rickettsiales bacterium]
MKRSYRSGVGIFLLNKKKKLWVGKRIDSASDFWQMPQGGIDDKETENQAMMRELKEEIGTNNIKTLMISDEWFKYDLPNDLVKNVWKGRYIGQTQKWYACQFQGKDNEIKLDNFKPEFLEWKWIDPKEALNLVIPFKKEMYKKILKKFNVLYA